MWFLLAAHAGVAAVAPWWARRLGRGVWVFTSLPPLATVAWGAVRAPGVLAGTPVTTSLPWAPSLGLTLDLRLDALSLLMLWVVGGVGAVVLLYCRHYVTRDTGREAGLLLAFAGAMTGLVLSDNLFLLYVFWELTTVASFLLIAGRGEVRERRAAAEQALLVTVAGGLSMLLGLVMLGEAAGSYRLSEVLADPPRAGQVPAALVLVLIGAFAKSAQMPLHGWLPAAMVAPTPVSAYLHAAAMVKAGVYLIARLAPGFADVTPWRPMVLAVGLTTLVLGAWRALRETDLKRLLAYGTVSMLGMLTALLGAGTRTAALAGATMLLAHAAYKSTLFLTVGVLDRTAGSRDLRELSGIGRRLPRLFTVALLAVASLAGLPPLLGFLGKEAALEAFLQGGELPGHLGATAAVAVGALLTAAYGARFLWGAFGTRADVPATAPERPALGFLAPVAVLSATGAVLGVWYGATSRLVSAYADGYPPPAAGPYHLVLWHGLTPVLGLSALTLVLGLLLHAVRARRLSGGGRRELPPDAQYAYRRLLHALDALAVRVTRRTQVGSLPVHLTVLLATVLVLPGTALALTAPALGDSPPWRTAMELPPALVALTAAAAVVPTTHRLTGVLLVSAVGYGVAGLFLVHGAPDLALTQFLVETMTLVVVVLVLRRMPSRFTPGHTALRVRALRAAVAVGTGALVAVLALAATSARRTPPVSEGILRRVTEAGAHNAVNAIVVDFRALDTLGEISVLLATAVGVVSVVRVWGRSGAERGPLGTSEAHGEKVPGRAGSARARWDEPRESWLPGAHERPGGERSLLLEVVTRVLFPSIVVFSLFLLFSGHYRPGGGFAGGLVAGQALVLRYLVGGRADFGLAAPLAPGTVAGAGLALTAGYGLLPGVLGAEALSSTVIAARLPVLGGLEFATSLFFDAGVYLLVVGVTLKLLSAVGVSLEARTS